MTQEVTLDEAESKTVLDALCRGYGADTFSGAELEAAIEGARRLKVDAALYGLLMDDLLDITINDADEIVYRTRPVEGET